MRTGIIIPYNQEIEGTIECIQRISDTTVKEQRTIILVHGVVGDEKPIVHPEVDVYLSVKNESYCKTINYALERLPSDLTHLFIMGNDSYPLTEKWLESLENALESNPSIKVLSPDYTRGGKANIIKEDKDFWYHNMLPSIHYFMRVTTQQEIGLLNEQFVGACYYSDDEYCERIIGLYGAGSIARSKHILFEHRLSVEGKVLYKQNTQMGTNYQIYQEIKKNRK